ncbi:hypothetical protein [Paucibacter soli]|uniref:hypothetical protein n=1 Tax=Paucibacter soli TaxID=3133433 RepID=UPI0030A4AD62
MNRQTNFLRAALAAMLMAGVSAAPATAQPAAHSHEASAPHKLSLDKGRKWATDAPLREGMSRIRELLAVQLAAAHAGKLDEAGYRELAGQVEAQVGAIVAQCKLEPRADAMLHLVIAELGEGSDAMAGKTGKLRPEQGLIKTAQAVNAYGSHFAHPGFKPLHIGH